MKKILFAAIALAAVTTTSASAQAYKGFTFGPKAGINISKPTNASGSKALAGLTAGAFAEYGFNNWFSLSLDALYSRQGYNYDIQPLGGTGFDNYKATTDYLNIPVLANFYVWKGLSLKAGLQPGFLLGAHLRAKVDGEKEKTSIDGLNSFDLSIPVGVSYSFKFGLIVDARYNFGVTKIFPGDYVAGDYLDANTKSGSRNSVFAITLGWRF